MGFLKVPVHAKALNASKAQKRINANKAHGKEYKCMKHSFMVMCT